MITDPTYIDHKPFFGEGGWGSRESPPHISSISAKMNPA